MHDSYPPIVVFSHLRWDFVYQRPQHLLSRLARRHRVIFIEEPQYDEASHPHWELTHPVSNVVVCRPHIATGGQAFGDAQLPVLTTMLAALASDLDLSSYILWLYTPMAVPLARTLSRRPLAVIYDCMDELSAFRFAPPELMEREASLLAWADVVFTGGPSLYRAKQGRHHNLRCFPSSVDVAHFGKARAIAEASDLADIPHPRLGWFGVIDERMDLALLSALADAHPEWAIVMIGPVVKIDPASLPQRPNIHYLGPRLYAELPSYLAGWDLCIQPFALNEATRFISPTKTLEYMAAGLPIASTPITDVAEPYGQIVYLGAGPSGFVAACEQALSEEPERARQRQEESARVLARTSWDRTAAAIQEIIDGVLARQRPVLPRSVLAAWTQ